MVLTLHNLARAYKMLPSDVLCQATTFDLYVLDVATKWQNHQQAVAAGKEVDKRTHPSESEMLEMIKRARGEL